MLDNIFLKATLETVSMVFVSSFLSAAISIPLGFYVFACKTPGLYLSYKIYQALSFVINIGRSLPFIILMIAIIPFTRFLIGTSIGTKAAIVPLTISAIPFLARIVENTLSDLPSGLLEASKSMGASPIKAMRFVLWPEALFGIINGITLTLVNLIGYSAMAGAVGGGGLGDLAIRYGYQRFDFSVMTVTIIILIVMVQITQFIGDKLASTVKN